MMMMIDDDDNLWWRTNYKAINYAVVSIKILSSLEVLLQILQCFVSFNMLPSEDMEQSVN